MFNSNTWMIVYYDMWPNVNLQFALLMTQILLLIWLINEENIKIYNGS
jgi:hypothetical protein